MCVQCTVYGIISICLYRTCHIKTMSYTAYLKCMHTIFYPEPLVFDKNYYRHSIHTLFVRATHFYQSQYLKSLGVVIFQLYVVK